MCVTNTKELDVQPYAYSANNISRVVYNLCYVRGIHGLYSDNDIRHICIWCLRETNTREEKKTKKNKKKLNKNREI